MPDQLQPPSDVALEEQTRAGSDAAWAELRARHLDAVDSVARSRDLRGRATTATSTTAAEAFRELRNQLDDPPTSDRPPRPIRPRAIGLLTGGDYGPGWSPPSPSSPSTEADGEARADAAGTDVHLVQLATAFGRLPTIWQTVLWHRWVEQAPAAELTAMLGRRPADVVALEQTARRGLVDLHAEVMLAEGPAVECVPVIPLLGAFRRNALPDAQRRTVLAHVGLPGDGCDACQRRLDTIDRLPVVLPIAIVPGLVGTDVDRYRQLIGAGVLAMGTAGLAALRSERNRRRARVGAAAAIVLALLAAALFVREPFGDLDSELADLLATTTTEPTGSPPGAPTTTPGTATPGQGELPNRIELVFPGVPQGAVYVPGGRALDLGISLSAPAPVFAGATGTIDAAITNNDSQDASVRFLLRSSPGVSFDRLVRGIGACVAEPGGAGRCTLTLPAGTTAELSLRFGLDVAVPDRLVVVPSIGDDVLDVPVESVPDLLLAQVGRAELRLAGATVGSCQPSSSCPDGQRNGSSATLSLPPDGAVDRALLVWQGDRAEAAWADTVGLIPAGSSTALGITGAALATPTDGDGDDDAGGFRSVADVTDLVRAAGGGTYTFVRPPSLDEPGDGSWTLVVVVDVTTGPSQLLLVVITGATAVPDDPFELAVPIGGSTRPETPRRPVSVLVQASTSGTGRSDVTVDGTAFVVAETDGVVSYDLDIASAETTLTLTASTTADELRLASIGLAADIVP